MKTQRSLLSLAAAVIFSGSVLGIAGNVHAENVISMGYAEANAGVPEVAVIVTATNDIAVHGYSIAFTFPTQVLRLQGITVAGTHIGLLEPDFVGAEIDNVFGVGSLGVIFNYNFSEPPPAAPVEIKELPPTPANATAPIIARLSFNVRSTASGGVYPLALRDGIGTPAAYNRFTRAGTSFLPRLEDGSFAVSGGNTLSLEKKVAFAGATPNLPLFARVQHARPLEGFQIAFTYDKRALTLNSATLDGTDMFFELGGASFIEFSSLAVDLDFSSTRARSTAAVLFDYLDPAHDGQVLPPSTTGHSIVKYGFNVRAQADDGQEYQELLLENLGITGAIDNRFFINGASVDPRLVSGKIYFSTGDLTGRVVDSETLQAVRGVRVTTDPEGNSTTTNTSGNFTFSGIPPGMYALTFTKQGYYSHKRTGIVVRGAGLTDNAGNTGVYKIPQTPPKPFLRGYINRDRNIDLSDGITILNFLFAGAAGLPCLLAADVNDSNTVDLSDAIYLLNYLFVGGLRPKPPFSPTGTNCGDDPTPLPDGTTLSCDEFDCQ